MFSVSKILQHLSVEEPLEPKKIEKIFKLTKKTDKGKLEIALTALSKIGILEKNSDGFKLHQDNLIYLHCRLRCSSKGYSFAVREDGGEDIYIREHHLNHAWHGDRVLVKISREAVRRRSPEGIIQCVLQRESSTLLCLIKREENCNLAVPLDDRIHASIEITDSLDNINQYKEQNQLFEVQVDRFPIAQYQAIGHILRPLSLDNGIKGDREILLTKVGLHKLPAPPKSAIKEIINKNREDLTLQNSLLINSWTGQDCPPYIAINVEPKDGGIRLWVHTPAIAERVNQGNALDKWLMEKAHSHCLGDLWDPLLPIELTNKCRFKVNQENKSVSVCLDIDKEGIVSDWRFTLSNIRPAAEISLEQLNAVSKKKNKSRVVPSLLKSIKDHISQIETMIFAAKLLKQQQIKNGLIELDLDVPDLQSLGDIRKEFPGCEFTQWTRPIDTNDPMTILSTFVRAANHSLYKHFKALKVPGLVFDCEPTEKSLLNDVAKSAISMDVKIELDDEGLTSASQLSELFKKSNNRRILDKQLKHVLNNPILTNNYKFTSDNNNDSDNISSINYQRKSPFCSPTLNYYAIINQRIITTLLKEGKTRPNSKVKDQIDLGKRDCIQHVTWDIFSKSIIKQISAYTTKYHIDYLNHQLIRSRNLRNGFISMAQARSAQPIIGSELEATISGVQSYGFFAEIIPTLAEGLVHVSSLSDDWYEYRSRQTRLVGRKNKKTYQIGDIIKVKIVKVDIIRNQIDLEVIDFKSNLNSTSVTVESEDKDLDSNSRTKESNYLPHDQDN